MRQDALGLFWEDMPTQGRGGIVINRPIPKIPDNGWLPPREFPNLSAAKILGFDLETYDPELITCGPGWARNSGHIVGASLATEDGHKWYFPMRHEIQTELNMDPDQVLKFLADNLCDNRPKVGANLQYDYGWMAQEGIQVKGIGYDVQYAEGLLDEWAMDYSLDALGVRYVDQPKFSDELYKWSALAYGGNRGPRQRANIYRCPPSLVGPYAEDDADLPIKVLKKQWVELERAGLLGLFQMECKLIPILIGMRFRGLPYDEERVDQASKYLISLEEHNQMLLNDMAGFELGVTDKNGILRFFEQNKLKYPRTPKGAPSFTKPFLEKHDHPGARLITEIRKLNKARTTFLDSSIIAKGVDGKIFPSLHPLKGEQGGTGSGRFSSSHPNGQQFPSRDEQTAPLIRGCFVPEPGYPDWLKMDLSQIEYRMFAHESGDENLIREYQDPKADFHKVVSKFLGDKLPRKPVKNYNFMSLYGGGEDKATEMVKGDLEAKLVEELLLDFGIPYTGSSNKAKLLAQKIISLYEERFPAAKATLNHFMAIAENTGEIRTILNRRSVFQLWEPAGYGKGVALPRHLAEQRYGLAIKRAYCYRGLNRRLQGSSADLIKKAMLDAYEAGLFNSDQLGFPHITVHDEFDFSYHPDQEPYMLKFKEITEQAIPLKVPVIMDVETGPDWGHVK